MPRTLRARPVNAGTHENNWVEQRPYRKYAEKGGWIELEWETFNGRRVQVIRRRVQVRRDRAVQAMAALAMGKPIA